jgi:hypothetical protein
MKHNQTSQVTPEMIGRYWRISLLGEVIVLGAVAQLLRVLTGTAAQIQAGTGQTWTTG